MKSYQCGEKSAESATKRKDNAQMSENAANSKAGGRKWLRKLALLLVLFAALFTLVMTYLWSERRTLLSDQIATSLDRAGFEEVHFEVSEIGFSQALVSSVSIGDEIAPDLAIEDIVITYDLVGLWRGRIDTIELDALSLKMVAGPEGVSFGALDPLLTPEPEASEEAEGTFTVGNILIRDIRAAISLPQGEVALQAGVSLSQEADGWRIEPLGGCAKLTSGVLQTGAVAVGALSTELCLGQPSDAIYWPMTQALVLESKELPILLSGDQGEILVSGHVDRLGVELQGPDLAGAKLSIAAPQVTLPGFGLALSDANFEAVFDLGLNNGEELAATWSLRQGNLQDLAPAPRFSPMRVAGDGNLSGEKVSFDLIVSDRVSFTPLSSIAGEYRLIEGVGLAEVNAGPLNFSSAGLQPQGIVPALQGMMTNVVGSVSGVGHFRWQAGRLTSAGTVELDEVGLSTAAARVEGVSGKLTFRNLVPPMTALTQTLKIGLVDAGFQLLDGTVAFKLSENGSVQIEEATWPFAGGSISLSSGLIEPGASEQELVLDVVAVELSSLIGQLSLDGVSGTGVVSGRVPITLRDGNPIITGAQLTTSGPGQLSYVGAGTGIGGAGGGEGQSALLFQALENFQYTGLTLFLDGNAQDRLTVKLNLEGANPELYDGYPFIININTEASFAELFHSVTLGTNALDLIRENGAVGP